MSAKNTVTWRRSAAAARVESKARPQRPHTAALRGLANAHAGQGVPIAVPHSEQNFTLDEFSVPQFAHVMCMHRARCGLCRHKHTMERLQKNSQTGRPLWTDGDAGLQQTRP